MERKFILGLPKLLEEKVKNNIAQHFRGKVLYEQLTFGQSYSYIVETEIQICNDFKLQNKLRNEA